VSQTLLTTLIKPSLSTLPFTILFFLNAFFTVCQDEVYEYLFTMKLIDIKKKGYNNENRAFLGLSCS